MVNEVAKVFTVRAAAPWVRPNNHVTLRRHKLDFHRKMGAICGMRSAVNF